MYVVKKAITYGTDTIEKITEEYQSFAEAKTAFRKLVDSSKNEAALFDENGDFFALKKWLYDYFYGNDYSFSFYESLMNFMNGSNVDKIAAIKPSSDYEYIPGCEDEDDEEMVKDDEEDIEDEIGLPCFSLEDEVQINPQFDNKQKLEYRASENVRLKNGPCFSDGFYVYNLIVESDGELSMYMCPTDHERKYSDATGIVDCNAFTMNIEKKSYVFRLVEITNDEGRFPLHKGRLTLLKITMDYVEA